MRNANQNTREAKVSKACGCLRGEFINQKRRWFKCSVVLTAIARIITFFRVMAFFVMIAVIRRTERVELQKMKTMFVWYESIPRFISKRRWLLVRSSKQLKGFKSYIGNKSKRRN
jgi:hypothetical protein